MFRTIVQSKESPEKIRLGDRFLSIGSCFATHIGEHLAQNKFSGLNNPFGTIFNPYSIFKLLDNAVALEPPAPERVVENQGVYHHYDTHSDLSAMTGEQLLKNIRRQLENVHNALREADWILVTLGTAIVYELKVSGEIVANCHKVPAAAFQRRFLEIDEILAVFKQHCESLATINTKARYIVTVSPVRHLRESFEDNSLSKSILRVACDKICREYSHVLYFPAYEIMMDDLRDYRFYTEDMLHPSPVAVDYIWQKFIERHMDKEALAFIQQWDAIRKALAHRPFNPGSPAHQDFIKKTIARLLEFSAKINVKPELQQLKSQLL